MISVQEQYKKYAYERAGITEAEWMPELGFKANEKTLHLLYKYYQAIYFLQPQKFYWAGLARLTGGQVLYGMNNVIKIAKDPCVLTQQVMSTAKDIFDSIAWQHELFLADKNLLLQTCMQADEMTEHTHSYTSCWQSIMKDDAAAVAQGNQMLLHNEQLNTIQQHYELIKKDPYSRKYFWLTKFVMRRIHPYHRRFITQYPFADVTVFNDRWQWITNNKGMWTTWVNILPEQRNRLVALSNEDVMLHKWKPQA